MHLLTKTVLIKNTCIFKKTSNHNWHRFKKEKKKKKDYSYFPARDSPF